MLEGTSSLKRHATAAFCAICIAVLPPITLAQRSDEQSALVDFFQAMLRQDTKSALEILSTHTNIAHLDASRLQGKMPLHVAASMGQVGVVDKLLKLGADVNGLGDSWNSINAMETPLQVAIRRNQPAVCKRLLDANPNVNQINQWGTIALNLALDYNRQEIAGWLLDSGANPFLVAPQAHLKITAFELAITRSDGKLVPKMLELPDRASAFLGTNGTAMLEAAVVREQVDAVRALLKAGVSPKVINPEGRTLLQVLARSPIILSPNIRSNIERRRDVRDLLLDNGADYDVFAATGFGDLETARRMGSSDAKLPHSRDNFGATPLHWSVEANQLPLTSFWLESGASLAATNRAGQTPAHIAAARGFKDQLARLLAANTPLDVRDTNGATPLDAAMQAKQTEAIRLLMIGGHISVPDRGISTTLHEAAASGNILLISTLVNSNTVNARNELGFTPLHLSVQRGQLGAAALLLDKGADIKTLDAEGNTILHLLALNPPNSIAGRPSPAWLARWGAEPQREKFLRFFNSADEDRFASAAGEAAALLMGFGADAGAKNKAGKTFTQIVMDKSSELFDHDRTKLLAILGGTGAHLDETDANGDTPLHHAAREKIDGDKTGQLIEAGANVNAANRLGRTPLHCAVENLSGWGGLPLSHILNAKPDVNARDNAGLTALHVLLSSKSIYKDKATKALLDAGANPNIADNEQRTPIHVLLNQQWPWLRASDCIPMLIAAGADPFLADQHKRTVLHYLAAAGNDKPMFFIRNLESHFPISKFDVNARDENGDTALHIAARKGTTDIFEWLSNNGGDLDLKNDAGETPRMIAMNNQGWFARFKFSANEDIHAAAKRGDAGSVGRLVRQESRLLNTTNQLGETPLRIAARHNQTNVVAVLIEQGAEWDEVSAALLGRGEILKAILSRRPAAIKTTAYGQPLLHLAAESGNLSAVETVLAAGAILDGRNNTGLSALGVALQKNRTELAKALRARGATENIFDCVILDLPDKTTALIRRDRSAANEVNSLGMTPIHVAVAFGRGRLIEVFLKLGTSPDGRMPHLNLAPLHVAAACNRTNEVAILLTHKADPQVKDNSGCTPLHYAAAYDAVEIVGLLIQHGANPNAVTGSFENEPPEFQLRSGSTALHLAVQGGCTNVIDTLIKAGANVNATNSMGATPLDLASFAMQGPMRMGMGGFTSRLPGFSFRMSILQMGVTNLDTGWMNFSRRSHVQSVTDQIKAAGGIGGKPPPGRLQRY